ncbi:MAG: hypothetical protein H6739_35660 [Alphaproteobacteria bacterium]|nr:hypothetical protein [Alphaproteobacteria bacterium]
MRASFIALLAAAACSGKVTDDTGSENVDPSNVPLDGVCDQALRWGGFTVDSNEDYATVDGQVSDGVVPADILTELVVAGDCTIWRRENPFCDPGCASGTVCDHDGQCVPYPEGQNLGTVTVSGLSTAVSMEPVEPGWSYFDTSLDNPPWTPGDLITLRTGEGVYDPVTMHGVAPEALVIESADWYLTPGEPFTVRWDAASEGTRTEVVLRLRVDQHGLTPSALECVFEDDGEGEVPAATFDSLVEYGLTGFPFGDLRRRTVDHAALSDGGCAEFHLTSSRLARVEVEGYTPCRTDRECPDGQECNELLERCE